MNTRVVCELCVLQRNVLGGHGEVIRTTLQSLFFLKVG